MNFQKFTMPISHTVSEEGNNDIIDQEGYNLALISRRRKLIL